MIEAIRLPQKQTEPLVPRRIVVTGIGAVTPLGIGANESWRNVVAGHSGITPLRVEIPESNITYAGQIPEWDKKDALKGVVEDKNYKRLSDAVTYGMAAILEAGIQAGIYDEEGNHTSGIDSERVGVEFASGFGGAFQFGEIENKFQTNPRRIEASDLLKALNGRVATVPSIKFGLKGPVASSSNECASGNIAFSNAINQISRGKADIMIAGATEAPLKKYGPVLFERSRAISHHPDYLTASRPFDQGRSGFVIAEGAGAIIFEELNHALQRGAPILAEFVEYGNTGDAFHDTAPAKHGYGAQRAMHSAMEFPSHVPSDLTWGIWHINAHGTSTPEGDAAEAEAIKHVIPENERRRFPVSSYKGAIGHALGAAGAIEGVFAVKTLQEDTIPGTLNLSEPIEEAEGLELVYDRRHVRVEGVISNSFGFGGINSSVVFARYNEPNDPVDAKAILARYKDYIDVDGQYKD